MATCGENFEVEPSTSSGRKRGRAEDKDSPDVPMAATPFEGKTLVQGKDFFCTGITRGKISTEQITFPLQIFLGERYISSSLQTADLVKCVVQAWITTDVRTYKFLVFLYVHAFFLQNNDFTPGIRWQVGVFQEKGREDWVWTEIREVKVREKGAVWRFVDFLEFMFETIPLYDEVEGLYFPVNLRLILRLIVETPPTAAEQALALQEKLKELYLSLNEWDVTINLKDATYRAHRSILRDRAAILAGMLLPVKTTSSRELTITIEDCEANAFAVFLLHVYSGEVENLTRQNILDVYYIAVKYDIQRLKEGCLQYTLSNWSLDSILRIIAFGRKYDERMLAASAVNFFLDNALQILGRDGWRRFEAENRELADDLRRMTLKCYRSSR